MSKVGDDILEALREALAHSEGKPVLGIRTTTLETDDVDALAIRKRLKLTQEQMARALGTSASGYRKWEQGVRHPSGAARNLLRVMDREPEAVMRALWPE